MNEVRTHEFPDNRSFEERVFARFDSMDARVGAMEIRLESRFDRVDARLDGLDIRVHALEARALDTKPIWERALAEILEVKKGVEDINRKIDVPKPGRLTGSRRSATRGKENGHPRSRSSIGFP